MEFAKNATVARMVFVTWLEEIRCANAIAVTPNGSEIAKFATVAQIPFVNSSLEIKHATVFLVTRWTPKRVFVQNAIVEITVPVFSFAERKNVIVTKDTKQMMGYAKNATVVTVDTAAIKTPRKHANVKNISKKLMEDV